MAQVRINKYISDTGFCSRREADQLVEDARVEVNGTVAVPGTKVSPGDTVRIDGEVLRPNPESFVERPKLPKPKKRPVRYAPVEEEETPVHRSHRGTRGGLRNRPRPGRCRSNPAMTVPETPNPQKTKTTAVLAAIDYTH